MPRTFRAMLTMARNKVPSLARARAAATTPPNRSLSSCGRAGPAPVRLAARAGRFEPWQPRGRLEANARVSELLLGARARCEGGATGERDAGAATGAAANSTRRAVKICLKRFF